MKFKDYTVVFLKEKEKQVKKSTYCNYANNLKKVNKYIGDIEIDKINTKTIEKMCIQIIEDEYSYKTYTDMKMITKSVLKQAKNNNDKPNCRYRLRKFYK